MVLTVHEKNYQGKRWILHLMRSPRWGVSVRTGSASTDRSGEKDFRTEPWDLNSRKSNLWGSCLAVFLHQIFPRRQLVNSGKNLSNDLRFVLISSVNIVKVLDKEQSFKQEALHLLSCPWLPSCWFSFAACSYIWQEKDLGASDFCNQNQTPCLG